jgi:ribose transport system substrate-binding protein
MSAVTDVRRGGRRRPGRRRGRAAVIGVATIGLLLAGCGGSSGTGASTGPAGPVDVGAGIAAPKDLAPFQFGQPAGEKPDLPKRIAWANTSDAAFFLQITDSIELAAKERGLDFVTAIANDDSAKNVEQIETFLQRGVGALCIQPLDANAQAPLMKRAIESGAAVLSLVTPPSTSQVVADQYKVGNTQGLAAAKYITEKLGGKAKVVYFNTDTIEVLKARHQGVLDGLKTAGAGVEIVADVQPPAITQDGGFKAMSTILQKTPGVDVVLGGDTYVLGALSALQSAQAVRPDMYLSGIDGDEQALAEVGKGGIYRASFAFAYPLMGYAWGQFAADWLDGKPIPQVMQFNAIELNSPESIATYKSDMASVAQTWKDAGTYFTMLGSISYQTRNQYINDAA